MAKPGGLHAHGAGPRAGDVYTSRHPWAHGRKVRVEVQPGTGGGTVWWRRVGVDHLAHGDEVAFHEHFALTAPAAE